MGLLLPVKSTPELTELQGVVELASGQLVLPGPCRAAARKEQHGPCGKVSTFGRVDGVVIQNAVFLHPDMGFI